MSEDKSTSSGVGFTSLLLLAFIILKLCKVINWSWWWVLSPIWITAGIVITVLGVWALWLVIYKFPDEKKRIASGMHEAAWKAKKRRKPYIEQKSKWQERIEQMQNKKTQ